MTTIITILAFCIICIILMVIYIYYLSDDAMNQIMLVESGKKWEEVEGLDGKTYWMPENNCIKTKSTVK